MSSVGETLRRERLRQNLDLEQISRELKISSRFLEAIEGEHFDRLPAGVFAKSFVRQYARLLGIDDDELASQMQRAIEPPSLSADSITPHVPPLPDIQLSRVDHWQTVGDRSRFDWSSSLPALALVVVVMLVCSGVYALWQRARQPIATAQTASPPAAAAPTPAAQVPAQQPPVQPEPVAGTQPTAPTESAAPPATPAAPQSNSADRQKTGSVHVELLADEPVWVLARADGKFLFSGTLDARETRVVDANERATVRLGNAGGVSVTLNGKSLGQVGPKGQVREVQFTSGGFQIVAAPKPSLPEDNPI